MHVIVSQCECITNPTANCGKASMSKLFWSTKKHGVRRVFITLRPAQSQY